jgi:YidC/Oxa1 family membrane protein insertase
MNENRNYILAIALSVAVLILWQFFVAMPRMEEQQRQAELQQQQQTSPTAVPGTPVPQAAPGAPVPGAPPVPGAAVPVPGQVAPALTRQAALDATPRIQIDTPELAGSIALVGGRIDDLALKEYRETVSPASRNIVLLSPSGAPDPYYVEFGWTAEAGAATALPGPQTEWRVESGDVLAPGRPVTLAWDNGQGLIFRRTYAVDEHYMFTVEQSVANTTGAPVTLYPYGLVSRHGTPPTAGYYILHEGLIGVMGEDGLVEVDYEDVIEEGPLAYEARQGWLGITDKYWATALVPDQSEPFQARFSSGTANGRPTYQADYLLEAVTVAPGATAEVGSRVFAGAKRTGLIEAYEDALGILNFDLLIDWGWFYFITKPLFHVLDFFNRLFGNFGVAILIVTVLIKLVFFPLANKSYVSMSRMKKVQPEMMKIRERFADDRMKQQQELMELYKREKINALSGCLPIVIQIPVFFALYKVLFVTIEMRHAPFFGWIQDLSAPDPTTIFNLFGLIPWDPPQFLMLGIWPIIMGITMFVQMKLNPAPTDPTQQMIFNWMPLIFTFVLAGFPAGLVIYWAWNNFLSILQQSFIMSRQGVKVELWDNIKSTFTRSKSAPNS